MARKILIIIAFIIAVFPFFGFSEPTDNTVTTILALFIAVTLLFSRRPRMIPNTSIQPNNEGMPSPFVKKALDIPSPRDNERAPVIANIKIADSTSHIITPINPVEPKAVPSFVPLMPRKRTSPVQKFEQISNVTDVNNISNIEKEVASPVRRPRKSNTRTLLAYEDQVQPADVPLKTESHMIPHSKISHEA